MDRSVRSATAGCDRLSGMRTMLALLALFVAAGCRADDAFDSWRAAHEHEVAAELVALLRLPNVATDAADIRRNADAIVAMLRKRGLEPRLLTGTDASAPPAVYAEWRAPNATRTLVFYAHYDGQPVDASEWTTDPWTPTWRDARHDRGGKPVTPATGERI